MNAVRRLLTPWKVLIAAVVICSSASPAKADLFLDVFDNNAPKHSIEVDVTTHPTGTTAVFPYTFSYSVSSVNTASEQQVSMSVTIAPKSGLTTAPPAADFTIKLFSSTASSIGGTPNQPKSGFFSPIGTAGTALTLTSTTSIDSLTASSGSVQGNAKYVGYDGSTKGGIQTVSTASQTQTGTGSTTNQSSFTEKSGTTSDDLSAIAVHVKKAAGSGDLKFTTTATLAMPEPSGVAAAMAGLPCLGLLVGLVRRRRVQLNPVQAA